MFKIGVVVVNSRVMQKVKERLDRAEKEVKTNMEESDPLKEKSNENANKVLKYYFKWECDGLEFKINEWSAIPKK